MSNPFDHHKRGSMTPQRRAKVFAAQDGRCHKCSRRLGPSDFWIVEHVHALERGGTDEDSNLAITCEWCLPEKNAEDHAEAGHMRRSFTKHVVPKGFRKGRGWRS
jgi:5-methylcytosine-specific restriction endonuclease McrA